MAAGGYRWNVVTVLGGGGRSSLDFYLCNFGVNIAVMENRGVILQLHPPHPVLTAVADYCVS